MTLGAALLAFVLVHQAASSGPIAMLALAAPAAVALFVLWPRQLLVGIFVLVVLLEGSDPLFPQLAEPLYASILKGLTIVDMLILLLLAGTGLDAYRNRRRLVGAGPLSWPLVLLAAATLAGAATGHARGASTKALFEPVITLSHLGLLTIVVVNLARGRDVVRRGIALIAILAAAKSVLGLLIVFSGRQQAIRGAAVSYLEPTANWLVLLFLLGVLCCALQRVRLPPWAWGATPLALADFVLSYRRSFWIAAVVGIAVVVLLGSGRRGRRVVIPSVAVLAVAASIFLSHLGSGEVTSSPVLKRVVSLNPSSLTANAEDRYRIDERRNVLADLRAQPITGLGIAIPWTASSSLSLEHQGGREYVHFAALWYWMKLGLLGLLAYAALALATLWSAVYVWRRHAVALVRAGALALLGAVLGLLLAEVTASFTGVDYRFSIVYPVILGLLAIAAVDVRQARERASTVAHGGL
ncbi:MAG TPA: O-antigen ligase family protein [Solirubrobacteraceae bacterium]|nr:O-antigen ligase family protein [Solirubrobacteraceae bacterium]